MVFLNDVLSNVVYEYCFLEFDSKFEESQRKRPLGMFLF